MSQNERPHQDIGISCTASIRASGKYEPMKIRKADNILNCISNYHPISPAHWHLTQSTAARGTSVRRRRRELLRLVKNLDIESLLRINTVQNMKAYGLIIETLVINHWTNRKYHTFNISNSLHFLAYLVIPSDTETLPI